MKKLLVLGMSAPFLLTACGSGSGSGSAGSDDTFFVGSTGGSVAASGLPFATPSSVLADVEGETITVKVVRFIMDWDTNTLSREITEETLTIPEGDTSEELDDITLTLGGETLTFVDGAAPTSSAQGDWTSRDAQILTNVMGGSIYVYEYDENELLTGEFDSQAFFIIGNETDPDVISAASNTIFYSGFTDGYGTILDVDGNAIFTEAPFFGDINLIANLGDGLVSGSFDDSSFAGVEVEMSFEDAPIVGNGFVADLEASCVDFTCSTEGTIGGAFYGDDAQETGGIFGFDLTMDNEEFPENSRSAVVSGSFVASEVDL